MQVRHLHFQHKKGAPYFFKDLSFDLEVGKINMLVGKNGVGKSVLLQILSKSYGKEAVVSGTLPQERCALLTQKFDLLLADKFTFLENLQFSAFQKFPSPFSRMKTVVPMNLIEGDRS